MMSLGFIPWFRSSSSCEQKKHHKGGPPRRVLPCRYTKSQQKNHKCIVTGVLNVVAGKKHLVETSRIVPAFRHCSHAARSESSISWATPTSLVTADGKTLLLWVLVRDITDILCRRWNPSLIWWHGMSAQSSSMLSMPAVLAKTTQCR